MEYPDTPRDVAQQMDSEVTSERAKEIGDEIGVDWDKYDLEEFRMGVEVELEHGTKDEQTDVTGDDAIATGKIALAHMKEISDYYTKLKEIESQSKKD